jgi:hypothetical protein
LGVFSTASSSPLPKLAREANGVRAAAMAALLMNDLLELAIRCVLKVINNF